MVLSVSRHNVIPAFMSVRIRAPQAAPAAVPWYLSGGIAAANCLAAYEPEDAASLAASYDNIAAPGNGLADGTYDAAPGVAPAWTTGLGWLFSAAEWLQMSIPILEGYTFLVKFTTGSMNNFACGCYTAPRGFGLCPRSLGTNVQYWSGSYTTGRTPALTAGVAGVAGAQPYRNGLADGAALAAWGGTISATFCAGRLGGYGAAFFVGYVAKLVVYNTTLLGPQMLAVNNAMGGLLCAFGDSITGGTGASDEAHRWTNIVATAKGWDLQNAGIGATPLQNTTQNTVAVIGGAVTNNGRDRYTTAILGVAPIYVTILYGLNDLRLNDAAFTAELFGNDLGEIVDGLVAGGITASNIIIGSPPYIPEASYALGAPWNGGSRVKHAAYTAQCASVATAKGCKYADVYQYMTDNGGDSLVSGDGIHSNDAGHAAIAACFLAEL